MAMGFMKPETLRSSPLVTPPSRPPALLVGRETPIGGLVRLGAGRISSCILEPGTVAAFGPIPMPTPLMAGIDIMACASRPSSLRSHCT